MKNALTFPTLSILLCLLAFNFHGFSQSKTVAHIDNMDKIEISKSDVENYIMKFGPMQTIEIMELDISDHNNEYFLLAKCKINNKENWVYIVQLKSKKNKLVIKKGKYLNACESDIISIDNFTIVNGEIKGCVKCNHKVMGK